MTKQLTIDRFEDDKAICEDETREMHTLDRCLLPNDASEGDIVFLENGKWLMDTEKTAASRKRIRNKMNRLWEK